MVIEEGEILQNNPSMQEKDKTLVSDLDPEKTYENMLSLEENLVPTQ